MSKLSPSDNSKEVLNMITFDLSQLNTSIVNVVNMNVYDIIVQCLLSELSGKYVATLVVK